MPRSARPRVWETKAPVASALFSDCGAYRLRLVRGGWDGVGWAAIVGLNPSKAAARLDDPTIAKEIAFAHGWGVQGFIKTNLYGWCATEPDEMFRAAEPTGDPAALREILAAACVSQFVVCAWGADPRAALRARKVVRELRAAGADLRCLGMTAGGAPRHPLYLPAATALVPFVGV